MGALILKRPKETSVMVDLRGYGLGVVEVKSLGNERLLIAADNRIPVHRKEVWERLERKTARKGTDANERAA